ncbi:MAG: hypothetical protein EOQ69_19425 [Mesorhizobium sp.]|uniref:LamG domain-containing protein n=1 Tax=Mesorhizobium sp. TaxID=1871066 RepID=UPI000FE5577F|nr:LamG-like jellyroll fold domain-containing protein [Mesorhizobium sp.]RWG80955.1 MAG: hypothetical protein EOQ69_19425 [Mesorhizobium sp.]RWK12543.1 MAG: hypothetical protein EOR39_02790 [Mesorhizobium sp.]
MAISFAGGTDTIGYQSGWSYSTGCFAFKMKTTQTTVNAVCASIWSSASRTGFGFILNNTANKLLVQGKDGTSTPRVSLLSTSNINDGNWHDVAFNWNVNNGGANALFIDGAQEASGNSSAAWSIVALNEPLTLGDNNDTFWPSYVGDLAEVAVWANRQLDGAEIAALAKGASPSMIAPGAGSGLTFHAPLVRSPNNRLDTPITGPTGTTVSVHPRIIGGAV